MAISSELIYLGCKAGCVEIWDRNKHNRIETLQTGTMGKVISMALDSNEDILVIGTSDGRIKVTSLLFLCRFGLLLNSFVPSILFVMFFTFLAGMGTELRS